MKDIEWWKETKKEMGELEAEIKVGKSDCRHQKGCAPAKATGYCLTCGIVLCEQHEMFHLTDDDFCRDYIKAKRNMVLIQDHLQKERDKSPDGKTSWERVEDFRLLHGHLPNETKQEGCRHCFPAPAKRASDGEG